MVCTAKKNKIIFLNTFCCVFVYLASYQFKNNMEDDFLPSSYVDKFGCICSKLFRIVFLFGAFLTANGNVVRKFVLSLPKTSSAELYEF